MSFTASDIAALRTKTGAGMMDCKKALDESNGDTEKAVQILREKGILKAAKRADKIAAEGLVTSYIHGAGRIGVLVEVNCETDFVAKTDQFKQLVNDIAMQIAAANPKYLVPADVSAPDLEKEKNVYREQLKNEGKPMEMIEKIVEGKMSKYYGEVCLLNQLFIKDETKTIEKLLIEKTAEIGEKITVRRFVRFELGEGLEKKSSDFAKEVAEQMG
ncbi:MAG: translation elongation factor Ts [Candidatus Magasanikbacteria bacterium]|nr:translation elongation factor Ts [Candidatus Magasanikbacteria bacterium]